MYADIIKYVAEERGLVSVIRCTLNRDRTVRVDVLRPDIRGATRIAEKLRTVGVPNRMPPRRITRGLTLPNLLKADAPGLGFYFLLALEYEYRASQGFHAEVFTDDPPTAAAS